MNAYAEPNRTPGVAELFEHLQVVGEAEPSPAVLAAERQPHQSGACPTSGTPREETRSPASAAAARGRSSLSPSSIGELERFSATLGREVAIGCSAHDWGRVRSGSKNGRRDALAGTRTPAMSTSNPPALIISAVIPPSRSTTASPVAPPRVCPNAPTRM